MMNFHGLTDQMLNDMIQTEIGVNVLSLMFRETTILRQSMDANWEKIARSNIHQFRYTALPYRYTKQFEKRLALLRNQPDFLRLWRKTRDEPAGDLFSLLRCYDYTHASYGAVLYTTRISTTRTKRGKIYQLSHIPGNDRTKKVFDEISKANQDMRKVMPWSL